jgi:hypothetical protein
MSIHPSAHSQQTVSDGGIPRQRGKDGKFLRGNRFSCGKGRPESALRQAIRSAVTPEIVTQIVARAAQDAIAGDHKAAALVLEHACGKPRPAHSDVEPIELGDLSTPTGITDALTQLARAASEGRIDVEAARALSIVLEAAVRGHEVVDLQRQVEELRTRIGG